MKITVTQAHIDAGKAGSEDCPIVLAVRETFPGKRVSVGATAIWVDNKVFGELPASARQFTGAFDRGYPVSPITFETL